MTSLLDIVSGDDHRASLLALRDTLAEAIDVCESMRDLAALSRQLTDVLTQIAELPNGEESDATDEIAKRRASRRSDSARSTRSSGAL